MHCVKILKLEHEDRNRANESIMMETLIRMNNQRAIIFPCENMT